MTEQDLIKFEGKFEEIYDEVHDLIIALKGYDGFPGLLKEFSELKNDFWSFVESKKDIPSKKDIEDMITLIKAEIKTERDIYNKTCHENNTSFKTLEKQVENLINKPGKTALKWINRVLVAIMGAAVVVFATLWLENRRITTSNNRMPSTTITGTVPSNITP